MKRQQVTHTIVLCNTHREARYEFQRFEESHSPENWKFMAKQHVFQAHSDDRSIEWRPIQGAENGRPLLGVHAIVIVTDEASRDTYRDERYRPLWEMINHMKHKYVHS